MNQQGIIIQARSGSTRLPNKVLLDFHEGQTILELIVRNLKSTFPDTKIILATTNSKKDNTLAEKGKELDLLVFRGSEDNVVSRFVECAKEYQVQDLIRICSDNPFLNMDGIKEVMSADFENIDYLSYRMPGGNPTIKSHLGLYVERVSLKALESVLKETKDSLYLEHVTNYLYGHPDKYNCQWLDLPFTDENIDQYRFTLDDKYDFELGQNIYSSLKTEVQNIPNLLSFVKENDLLTIMKSQIKKYTK